VWVAAEERVTRPLLAALDRLEQKRVRTGPQPEVGGERRVEVSRKLGKYGDEVSPFGELAELVARGRERRDG
jgi:hypothetical protein